MKKEAVKEAKDCLESVNNGISKTRDKSWHLMAFLIAIDVYLIKSIVEGQDNFIMNCLSVGSLPFSIYIFYHLYSAMLPVGMRVSGTEPDKIKDIISDGEEYFYDCLLHALQKSIDTNKKILSEMVSDYKKSLKAMIVFVIGIMLFLLVFFPFIKYFKC